MMFAGVVIYSRFLTTWPYRKIYVSMQALSALVSLFDIVIVARLNKKVGVPDQAMLLSDTTLAPCVLRLIMVSGHLWPPSCAIFVLFDVGMHAYVSCSDADLRAGGQGLPRRNRGR
jgi:hypothetical protein